MIKVYQAKTPNFFASMPMAQEAWYDSEYVHVADVDSNELDEAFCMTNSVNRRWYESPTLPGLTVFNNPEGLGHRSTSTGDILELNGEFFLVALVGFKPITLTKG